MTVQSRNRLIALSVVVVPFFFFISLVLFWEGEPMPPLPPLPHPNGYADLVKAGQMIKGDVGNYGQADTAKLHELVATNTEAMTLALGALTNPCAVTLQFSKGYLTNHLHDLASLKKLAQAFACKGRLAEAENHFDAATKSDLDLIHLGNASAHGGVLIDQMVSTAMKSIGVQQLQKLIKHLNAKSCRQTARALAALDAQSQTWPEVLQQENGWSRRTFTGLRYKIFLVTTARQSGKIALKAKQGFDEQQSKTHELIVKLASRAYELDKGHPPAQLADLVPDYLETVPRDSFTGTNLVQPR